MSHTIEWLRFINLVHQASADGATINPPRIDWDVSMFCEKPYEVILESYPPNDINGVSHYDYSSANMRTLHMDTPCRKCLTCLENRRRFWQKRAQAETKNAPRTWFCTYTINPEWRFKFSLEAGSMNYHDSYRVISHNITKYFKRLRKAGHKFRYMMVAESHKDGYPHIHLLMHEVSNPIPKRIIQAEWKFGFSDIKLVKDQYAAKYVTKYLSKDMKCRVRASIKYGSITTVGSLPFGLDQILSQRIALIQGVKNTSSNPEGRLYRDVS